MDSTVGCRWQVFLTTKTWMLGHCAPPFVLHEHGLHGDTERQQVGLCII
jgi:hypothetical protein